MKHIAFRIEEGTTITLILEFPKHEKFLLGIPDLTSLGGDLGSILNLIDA